MNKMGLFIQPPGAGLDLIVRYKPRAALLMGANAEHIQQAKTASPGTDILVWHHEDYRHWSTTDPVAWADYIGEQIQACPPTAVAFWNENLAHNHYWLFADYDARQAAFMDRMQDHYGIPVGTFAMGEGNFTKDGPNLVECFPKTIARLQVIFIHEYWFPRVRADGMEGYHCLRWPYWLEWLDAAGLSHVQIYVTECGLTSLINHAGPDEGWLGETAKAYGVTDEVYFEDLAYYHAVCCQYPRIKAVVPFLAVSYPGQWETFRLTRAPALLDRFMALDAPGPEEPSPEPEPPDPQPPPQEGDEMKVINKDGQVLTGAAAEDLIKKHGLTLHYPTSLVKGQWFWDIVEMREGCGPACFIFSALDAQGNPLQGIQTAFGWNGMSQEDNQIPKAYPTDWRPRAVLGPTNEDGNNGPGFGASGWWHAEYQPGPGYGWIRDPDRWAVFVEGIGMLGMTNHCTMYATWQLRQWEGGSTPTPDPPYPPGDGLVARLRQMSLELADAADYLEQADQMADDLADLL